MKKSLKMIHMKNKIMRKRKRKKKRNKKLRKIKSMTNRGQRKN